MWFLTAGLWAFVAPASFFEQAAAFEPYDVHLIRDLGAFQIGLGAVLLLAAVSRDALLVALAGVGRVRCSTSWGTPSIATSVASRR